MLRPAFDPAEALRAIGLFYAPGEVIELRLFGRGKNPVGGFFNDWNILVNNAERYSKKGLSAYLTLNPPLPALLSRINNKVNDYPNDLLTKDTEILVLRWLYVDIDPKRVKGVASTDEEKNHAREVAKAIIIGMREDGWAEPIVGDSGNGYHIFYRIDLPVSDKGIVQNTLGSLHERYSTEYAEVDTKTFNPSRVFKLPGSVSTKGDAEATPDRPHRMAKIIQIPEE